MYAMPARKAENAKAVLIQKWGEEANHPIMLGPKPRKRQPLRPGKLFYTRLGSKVRVKLLFIVSTRSLRSSEIIIWELKQRS